MADNTDLRLSGLLRELELAGYDCDDVPYRKFWQGAVEHRFPARQINNVWHFDRGDTAKIAAALGLRLKPDAEAPQAEARPDPTAPPPRRRSTKPARKPSEPA